MVFGRSFGVQGFEVLTESKDNGIKWPWGKTKTTTGSTIFENIFPFTKTVPFSYPFHLFSPAKSFLPASTSLAAYGISAPWRGRRWTSPPSCVCRRKRRGERRKAPQIPGIPKKMVWLKGKMFPKRAVPVGVVFLTHGHLANLHIDKIQDHQ